MRRRSPSHFLGTVLWLAYLSADSVAVFVLGHLAVRGARGPEHELILFWAPFLLVHLGGQNTITALSVQDNELWKRHLLGFVSQVAVASYVVSKSSWPDKRLLAATVIVFVGGSLKYAGRTFCLYRSRPEYVRAVSLRLLSSKLNKMKDVAAHTGLRRYIKMKYQARSLFRAKFDLMLGKMNTWSHGDVHYRFLRRLLQNNDVLEIMSVDAPVNEVESLLVGLNDLPSMLKKFQSTSCLREPYEYVSGRLEQCYEGFYTKMPLLRLCKAGFLVISGKRKVKDLSGCTSLVCLIATMFQYLSTPVALVLFVLVEKGHQVHSRADIIVTYILLVGAIILDVFSASMSIVYFARDNYFRGNHWSRTNNAILSVFNCIQPSWCRKQWSEKLAQYNMVKRYTRQGTRGCLSSVRQRIIKCLIDLGVELLDPSLTHTPVTEDLKAFVLNSLVQFGTSKQYNIANFRGQLALQKWRDNGPGMVALYYSINGVNDFPRSILIWHIATDICYYYKYNSTTSTYSDKSKKKEMSRELSNYIMYLVFKCGVLRTSNSQLVHTKVHGEMTGILKDRRRQMAVLGEKEVVEKVFEGTKDKELPSILNEEHEQPIDTGSAIANLYRPLNNTMEAIYSPVLPHASKVAQELMGIEEEAERWDLIAAVWLEMLYYAAPRCGGAFHYHHLATGGEFVTHVLFLMRSLGPFLPGANGSTP